MSRPIIPRVNPARPSAAGEIYREAGKLAEERHDEIAKALKASLANYQRPNGIMMDSSSWKVTARNPA